MPLNTTIITSSGLKVDLLDPVLSVPIEDIAHALAYHPRFNCHLTCTCQGNVQVKFYSLAHHSIRVAALCPAPWQLEGLLHDAHEALIGDIPTPAKRAMEACGVPFKQFEDQIQTALRKGLGMPPVASKEAMEAVATADHAALLEEIPALFDKTTHISWHELGYDFDTRFRYGKLLSPECIRREFLRVYEALTGAADCRPQPVREGHSGELASEAYGAGLRGLHL